MKIVLFNNMLHILNLPSKVDGSFSLMNIPNSEEILANVEVKDNKWVINTVGDYKIADQNGLYSSAVLECNRFYILVSPNARKLLYVSDGYDETVKAYKVPDNIQFVVGKNKDNQLCYETEFLQGQHFALIRKNGIWSAKLAQGSNIYVNNNLVEKTDVQLSNGDIIFVYGLTIILAGNTILINNPKNRVKLDPEVFKEFSVKQEQIQYKEIKDEDFYKEDDYFFKTPRLRRFVETYKLKFASPPGSPNKDELPLLLTLGPSLTMAVVSIVMFVNMFANGNKSTLMIVLRSISVCAMLAGSLLWPNILRKHNKKRNAKREQERLDKYRKYLDDRYINVLLKKIAVLERELKAKTVLQKIKQEKQMDEIKNKSSQLDPAVKTLFLDIVAQLSTPTEAKSVETTSDVKPSFETKTDESVFTSKYDFKSSILLYISLVISSKVSSVIGFVFVAHLF